MQLLTETYAEKIHGVIGCYDRVIIHGTLQGFHYPEAMTSYLYAHKIRIFDYPQYAKDLRDKVRINAEQIAKQNNVKIEFIAKSHVRKETVIQKILKERGTHPGLVHIISVMEQCPAYKPWHDKTTHRTYIRPTQGKCLHFYFYFIDKHFGLCYLRVPTWAPFRLQFYFNGHSWLANQFKKHNVNYTMADNAFVKIDNFKKAQQLSDNFRAETLHQILDHYAKQFCPIIKELKLSYYWSIMQAEYATDIIFKYQTGLQNIYEQLIRTAIHTVKPDNIATFLGRKLHELYQGELGNNFNVRIEGTRIKHHMGPASIKMYDKFKLMLRIETSINDVSFFKHYRTVEKRNGHPVQKYAQMKKNIYSLFDLQKLLRNSNDRYIEFISSIQDNSAGINNLNKISKSVEENSRNYKGFNFFNEDDLSLLTTIARGEFNISGFKNKLIRKFFAHKTAGQISRILKRLRMHGLIKKATDSYKYYLTHLGRVVIATGLKIKELVIIPQLSVSY